MTDVVIAGATPAQLTTMMSNVAPNLRGVTLFPGIGHWVQQERPAETNAAVIEFLKSLPAR